jgi:succinoglycan biosynthesis transport protein ExoP
MRGFRNRGVEGEAVSDGDAGQKHATTLRDYLRVVRRRKWIILQAVVLVPLVAVGLSLRQPELYRASSEVLLATQNVANQLNGIPDQTISPDADRYAQTQANLARVPAVAREALRRAGLRRSVDDFLSHSTATAKTNADLLELSVEDHRPYLARRLATAYAQAFSHYRAQLDTASYIEAKRQANAELERMAAAHAQESRAYQELLGKRAALNQMIALLTKNAVPVKDADNATKVQPRPVRNGILGLVLGIVLGVALAFLREALDTRVRSSEDIEERLGIPLLARVPEPPRRLRKEDKLVMLEEPRGHQAETFRLLRTNLDFVRLNNDARTILVTSALEREGKSTTSANLAIAVARAGKRVALVDLDLRQPALDRFFDLRRRPGLTQIALREAELSDVLVPLAFTARNGEGNATGAGQNGNGHRIKEGELVVVGSGPLPPNPGEFVGTSAVARILEELRKTFDLVLIDTPPALQVGDAMALSSHVDGIIVVSRTNVVRRPILTELRRALDASPALKLGFVLTGAEGEDGYGYGEGGYYYHRAETREWSGVA